MAIRRLIASAFCLLALTLFADSAHAIGPSVPVDAMHFFSLAEQAFDEGRLADAEVYYLKALVIFPEGLGIRVTLGLCRKEMGKLALAWETMREVVEMADAQEAEAIAKHDSQGRKHARERREEAAAAMKEIVPKVGWVKIEFAPAAASITKREILRDGERMRAVETEALPVDAGSHTFVGRVGMERFWTETVDINPAEHTVSSPKRLHIDDTRPRKENVNRRLIGYIVGGVGLGAAVTGVTLLAVGGSGKDDLAAQNRCTKSLDHCDDNQLTLDAWRVASHEQGIGGALLGAGIVCIGIGLPLVFASSRTDTSPSVGVFVGPSSIQLQGRF